MNATMVSDPLRSYNILRALAIQLEIEWGVRPLIRLACGGHSDEHWQISHPACDMPTFVMTPDGHTERHPDGRRSFIDLPYTLALHA